MIRRDFLKGSSLLATSSLLGELGITAEDHSGAFPQAAGLTDYVAKFVVESRYEDLPQSVVELGKKSILDAFGLGLGGSTGEASVLIRKYLTSLGHLNPTATVIGSELRSTPRFAALANGISIHADDFDDTIVSASNGLGVHPSVTVLPTVLALAEARRSSGREILVAYHVGVEVEAKIAEAVVVRSANNAFHPTGTCGSFGSAAAAAKLLRLDLTQTRMALGLAASQASGLRENFGTMTKPFSAGHAAENGVVAAELSQLGWSASERILEAPLGYFRTESDTYRPDLILGKLGKPWSFEAPGVSIKPFPSGALTHPAMSELLRLIEDSNIAPHEVRAVHVATTREAYATLIRHHPTTGLEAKFSMEFCLAILLLRRRAGIADFSDAVVQRADVQEMITRIRYSPSPEAEINKSERLMSIVEIELNDGRMMRAKSSAAKGSPETPMSLTEVANKFRSCAEHVSWPGEKVRGILDSVNSLERLPDASTLSQTLAR